METVAAISGIITVHYVVFKLVTWAGELLGIDYNTLWD